MNPFTSINLHIARQAWNSHSHVLAQIGRQIVHMQRLYLGIRFKPKHDLFLTVTKRFLCLNLTRSMKPWFAEMYIAHSYSGDWGCCFTQFN